MPHTTIQGTDSRRSKHATAKPNASISSSVASLECGPVVTVFLRDIGAASNALPGGSKAVTMWGGDDDSRSRVLTVDLAPLDRAESHRRVN